MASTGGFSGENVQEGFDVDFLLDIVNDATLSAKKKLEIMKAKKSAISITDMFEMQMLMNHLSQLSEMSTSVISAAHSSVMSMARNVKG